MFCELILQINLGKKQVFNGVNVNIKFTNKVQITFTNSKQWGIIIDREIDFSHLENWQLLKSIFKNEIKVTNIYKGEYKGNCYIR